MKPSPLFQLRSLLILISLLVSILVSAGELHEVKLGKTQFSLKLSNNLVVEVGLHQMLANANCSYKNALMWGGDIDQPPSQVGWARFLCPRPKTKSAWACSQKNARFAHPTGLQT